MIDAGYNYDRLAEKMNWLGIDPYSIRHILITHQDTDHVGAVEADSPGLFQNAKLYIGEIENRYLTGEARRKVIYHLYKLPQVTINNEKVLLHDDGEVFDIDGIRIECFLVPGHTWGHMVYLVDGKYLFTGDTLWFGADGGCVSYDGFDETENTEFSTMLEETENRSVHQGALQRSYPWGLRLFSGGFFLWACWRRGRTSTWIMAFWAAPIWINRRLPPQNYRRRCSCPCSIPSSGMESSKSRILQKRLQKRMGQTEAYVQAFMDMLGGGRPYVTMKSCKNQFYSDLITPLPDQFNVPGTEIHIFTP